MRSVSRIVRTAWLIGNTLAASGVMAAVATGAPEQPTTDASLFRLFLKDGTTVASVGEPARVGDRVVLSLPLSSGRQPLASLAASDVDWARTDRYAEAVRAARYAATRGEADFAAMSALVARTLTDITVTPGAAAQLALAERARRTLANWPSAHYGYRAEEVRQTLSLLDEVVGGLRAAAGQTRFDVSLVAGTQPHVSTEAILGPPTLREAIEQALRLSDLAPSAADRVLLLDEARAALAEAPASAPDRAWRAALERRVASGLEAERRIDRSYRELTTSVLNTAAKRAANHDVRGLMAVRARVLERDRRLGRKRPDEIQALLAAIDGRLDAVRRLRLARDRWKAREPILRAYRDAVTPWLEQLRRAQSMLSDIRTLAGPPVERLPTLLRQLDAVRPLLQRLSVPDEARDAHAAVQSAVQLAQTAVRYRERAISGNDIRLAWDASAAAAGALMFLERAEASTSGLLRAPER
jgi:hypothetical protein